MLRDRTAPTTAHTPERKAANARLLATSGAVATAILASSCCIVPLALVTLGISGAWIANVTALEPYKPFFAAAALAFIALGFRHVYFTPKAACDDSSYCARPQSARLTKLALWFATVLVVLAITVGWWAPLFY